MRASGVPGKAGTRNPVLLLRRLYSGEGGGRHVRLALSGGGSCRCGIFLCRRARVRRAADAARGDFGDQRGQAADRVQRQPRIAAGFAAGRFGQHGAAEAELGRFLQPGRGLRHRADRAGQRDLAEIDRIRAATAH